MKNNFDINDYNLYIDMYLKIEKNKLSIIPVKYRVLLSVLKKIEKSSNEYININQKKIKNNLVKLMTEIIRDDGRYTIVEEYSGKRRNNFKIPKINDTIIDQYINNADNKSFKIIEEFPKLLNEIISNNSNIELKNTQNDIDLLFKDKNENYYYVEIKYNDDHDSGKAPDICRKFIKTYAYLSKELNITDSKKLKPILFFFTNKFRANTYLPEKEDYENCYIFRGKEFFDTFIKSVTYDEVVTALENFSENCKNIKTFDELYNKIMSLKI